MLWQFRACTVPAEDLSSQHPGQADHNSLLGQFKEISPLTFVSTYTCVHIPTSIHSIKSNNKHIDLMKITKAELSREILLNSFLVIQSSFIKLIKLTFLFQYSSLTQKRLQMLLFIMVLKRKLFILLYCARGSAKTFQEAEEYMNLEYIFLL